MKARIFDSSAARLLKDVDIKIVSSGSAVLVHYVAVMYA